MKYLILCILLSCEMLLHLPLYAQQGGDTATVEVLGLGKDAQAAEKNALYSAVEQAVGTYIDNETLIKNEELIHERLLTVAQGFVQKYEVLEPARERRDGSGIWVVKIRAEVRKSDVGAALRAAGLMQIAADGTAAWAAQITKLKSREDAMALIEKVVPAIPRNLILCRLAQNGPEIETIEDPKTGDILAVFKVFMEINLDWWSKEVVPALDAAFTALKLNATTPTLSEFSIVRATNQSSWKQYVPRGLDRGGVTHERNSESGVKNSRLLVSEPINVLTQSVMGPATYSSLPLEELKNSGRGSLALSIEAKEKIRFKEYSLPSDWTKKIDKLIDKVFWRESDAAFKISFRGDGQKEVLHQADYHLPKLLTFDTSGITLAPFFEFSDSRNPLLSGRVLTQNVVVDVYLRVPADVLKNTKHVILEAAQFGVKLLLGVATEKPTSTKVLKVFAGTLAEKIGILENDVIININGVQISQVSDITDGLQRQQESGNHRMSVIRDGMEKSLALP